MARTDGKTAFVFTGGGSLGAIQIGMLRVLLAAGVQPDFVVGASVGAINASYFAGVPTGEGVAKLERLWTGLRRSDIFPFTLASAIGLLRNPGNLVDPSRLRRIIETHLPYVRLEETQIPLHIMATSLQGLSVRLSSGPAVDAILASTAIPGIFPPVQINGEPLLDGAVAANTPMRLAVQLGASRIIILPTGYACALKEPPKRFRAWFGNLERHGAWVVPAELTVSPVFGSSVLDFREARFAAKTITLHATVIFGALEVIVPPQLAVECEGTSIFASIESHGGAIADPDRPLLRIIGTALFGNIEVSTRLPGESAGDARRRRRQERKALSAARRAALPPRSE